ncbi:Crp/Fnr family transcriptional regulator [Flavobacterium sp. W21_SRS_FM6]|uniref:Crp/Fnr family transcriptional regulator n=1 Tax=Flavobacterium sp. W21_SRS_FM6 TaxID=3240268 RepID=UPI003F902891
MAPTSSLPISNHLLDGLSAQQQQWFYHHSTLVQLEFGEVLCQADETIAFVYFPLGGFVSLLVPILDEPAIEMGLIGNEGMIGATLALGKSTAPMQCLVQGSGSALKLEASSFCQYLSDNGALQHTIHSYLYVTLLQLAQTGACNCFHEVLQRLARWLLMTHDRAHADTFMLTHTFLATMLGVRRSAVTIAAGSLQKQGLIRYRRGHIQILSREGLEHISCGCYFAALASYENAMGQ